MTELGKLTVPVEADTSKFVRAMEAAGNALISFTRGVHASAGPQRKMANVLKGTATEMNSVWSIAMRVTSAFSKLYAAAEEGSRNRAAQAYFEEAGKSLEKYRIQTRGLLADSDLVKKANLADSMGISEKTFLKLADIAGTAALKTGQSFDHMFDSIVVGTARSSRLLLDNLGIIVSQKTANENYAKSLKAGADAAKYKSYTVTQLADALSDEAKKVAFAEEVERQAAKTKRLNGNEALDNAEAYARLTAQIKNAADMTKEAAAAMVGYLTPAIGAIVEMVREAAEGWRNFFDTGSMVLSLMDTKNEKKADQQREQLKLLADIRERAAKAKVGGKLQGAADSTYGKFIAEIPQEQLDAAKEMAGQMNHNDSAAVALYEFARAVEEFQKLNAETKLFTRKLEGEAFNPLKDPDPDKKGKGKAPNLRWEMLKGLAEQYKRELAQKKEIDSAMTELRLGLLAGADVIEKVKKEEEKIYLRGGKAAVEQFRDRLVEGANRTNEKIERLQEEAAARQDLWEKRQGGVNAIAPFAQAAGAGDAGAFAGSVSTGLQTAFASADSALSTGLKGILETVFGPAAGAAAGPLGAVIALIASILLPAIASLEPVMSLFEAMGRMVGELVRVGLVPLLETLKPLEPALVALGQALGIFVRELIGPITKLMPVLVAIVGGIILAAAAILAFTAPLARLAGILIGGLLAPLFAIVDALVPLDEATTSLTEAFTGAALAIIIGSMNFMNAIIDLIRQIPGMSKFGDRYTTRDKTDAIKGILGTDQLWPGSEEDDENTDAVIENTKAVRDLAREFKNLPSGYKIAGADFATSRGTPRPVVGGVLSGDAASWANQRAGDAYRWRR